MRSERPQWPLELPTAKKGKKEDETEEAEEAEEPVKIPLVLSRGTAERIVDVLQVYDAANLGQRIEEFLLCNVEGVSATKEDRDDAELPETVTIVVRVSRDTYLEIKNLTGDPQAKITEVSRFLSDFIEDEIANR